MNANTETQLSKWWTTESARKAFERVEQHRRERIAKLTATIKARREELDAQIWKGETR